MDAVLAQAAERLERALRDQCRKKGIDPDAAIEKRLNPGAPKADGKAPDAVSQDRKPMIME